MPRVTVYCVQPFCRAGASKLASGDLRQFEAEHVALRAGHIAAIKQGGAIVYSVAGDPEADHWESPRLVASMGDVPEISF